MTSHDVVGRCRRIFGTRKVGHAGTLDPMATGVLVVGIERATKILGMLTATDKSYAATIRLGQTTSTEDAEGEVLQTVSAAGVEESQIERVGSCAARRDRPGSLGGQRHQGRRPAGLQIGPRRPRPSNWRRAGCASTDSTCYPSGAKSDFVDVDVEVDCSSGTYIRALARDVGTGSVWAVTSPRCAEPVSARSVSTWPPAWTNSLNGRGCRYTLDEACLMTFPRRDLSASEAEDTRHGRPLAPAGIDGVYAATAADGQVISLLRDEGKRAKSVVVLRPATL